MELLMNQWEVFQDVHDLGETLEIYTDQVSPNVYAHLMSPWEPIDRLTYLQKLFAKTPYYGRELRHFNTAPWWYRSDFTLEPAVGARYCLQFHMVDYYCKVWVNGQYCGQHQGYQEPFAFDVTSHVRMGMNRVHVKVWSPWDTELLDGYADQRFFSIKRQMVKGTYEHADGFIQRDVNPVGIIGPVKLTIYEDAWIETLHIQSDINGEVHIEIAVGGSAAGIRAHIALQDPDGQLCVEDDVDAADVLHLHYIIQKPKLWYTWDRGGAALYTAALQLRDVQDKLLGSKIVRFGFSEIRLDRTKELTAVYLNGDRIFLRGTAYFPDVYFADLPPARIRRDLLLMRQAGFNAIRVHVHVQQDCFYEACDEMGFLVFQDTDFSWCHPTDTAWIEQSLCLFKSTICRLMEHPSIGCWILLNEPDKWKTSIVNRQGCSLSEIINRPDSISKNIGERLVEVIKTLDPRHPYIRASYNEDDPESGDSHNYLGSLRGQNTQYTDIRGTKEKLNTEFGMDAPGCLENLVEEGAIYDALKPIRESLSRIQQYQYKLLKYYIEHYRRQKYMPCSGYFQFMFIDLCPQSFYGVLDYWGTPKPSWMALEESNQPVAVMAIRNESDISGEAELVIANDTRLPYSGYVTWAFMRNGQTLYQGRYSAHVEPDSLSVIGNILRVPEIDEDTLLHVTFKDGKDMVIARNTYRAPFLEYVHIPGHPAQINNELGVRLFRTVE